MIFLDDKLKIIRAQLYADAFVKALAGWPGSNYAPVAAKEAADAAVTAYDLAVGVPQLPDNSGAG